MIECRLALFIVPFVLASGCADVNKAKDEKSKKKPIEPKKLVGRIQSRPGNKDFVLIEAYQKWKFTEGATFESTGPGRSAQLVSSGEKMGTFIAADLESGTVEIGDPVYHRPATSEEIASIDPPTSTEEATEVESPPPLVDPAAELSNYPSGQRIEPVEKR